MGAGRQKRNGFEAFISNENLYTVILHFSNEDLLGSEQIKPNSLHIVDAAKLALSLYQTESNNRIHIGKTVKFTLYQLMEEATIKPEAAIAMETQTFKIDGNLETKIILDASEIIQSWFMDETSNQGLRVECDLCHLYGIKFTNEDVSLAIKVESTDTQKDMSRRATLNNAWANSDKTGNCPIVQHKKKPRCCRESMVVDFSQIRGELFSVQTVNTMISDTCR